LLEAVVKAIIYERHYVQGVHYMAGRSRMSTLFAKGKVFGDCRLGEDWLARVVSNPSPAWNWVFYKVNGSPISQRVELMRESNWFLEGDRQRNKALVNFALNRDAYGDDHIWVHQAAPYVLANEDMPMWLGVRE
jgi:hypothetical protein